MRRDELVTMQKNVIVHTDSKILSLDKIKDIETLKAFGTYPEAKLLVEEKVGVTLNVKDWSQLFKIINTLSLSVNQNIEKLIFFLDETAHLKELGSFSQAKDELSEILAFRVKARSWKELERNLKLIVVAFRSLDMTDKSAIFEKNKIRNFIHSSRLEGIQMSSMPDLKMADIIEKYRVNL